MCLCLCVAACGPVRVCCHQDHWKHHDRHHAAAIHVCLYRSPAFQGDPDSVHLHSNSHSVRTGHPQRVYCSGPKTNGTTLNITVNKTY